VLAVLRRIESRGTLDTAYRAGSNCSQTFRYAIATGRADRDPVPDLRGALPPARGSNFAAITEPLKAAELLRAIDALKGSFVVQAALRLTPLLFVRPGELRQAEWANIDLEKKEWRYRVTKTKTEPSGEQSLDDLGAGTAAQIARQRFDVAVQATSGSLEDGGLSISEFGLCGHDHLQW